MQAMHSTPPEDLRYALGRMLKSPIRTLVPPWSWKAAIVNAALRSAVFFATNLRSGRWEASKATFTEAAFALFAGGLIGAISQYLRNAKPLWVTALLVWAGLPGFMLFAQLGVHRLAHTPHVAGGVFASFCVAALAAAFTWYAMRQGAMLGGVDQTTLMHDVRCLPGITLDFVLAGPRLLVAAFRNGRSDR